MAPTPALRLTLPPIRRRRAALVIAAVLAAGSAGCASGPRLASANAGTAMTRHDASAPFSATDVARLLGALAADSMEGRGTATPGGARAARMIAAELARAGVQAAGDSGFFQRVALAEVTRQRNGQSVAAFALLPDLASHDTVPAERRRHAVNVIGVIPGSDPAARDEAVVVSAHYDHVGVGRPVDGDSIYNGADDDASGVIAVLGVARALAAAPPKRTVVFLLVTGEEVGLLGARWYLAHPTIPIARTVANLEIEMIGRPDSLAGGFGKAWLTGYERSSMGDSLRAGGIPLVPDPRPDQRFFQRSDNYAFALLGVPAHTISSFNLHADYHTPNDEADKADPAHMAAVIGATVRAVRIAADGPAPVWKPGGRPEARRPAVP